MPRPGRRKQLQAGGRECVYCGRVGETTADHVVPRCLFQPPLPDDMITVPACRKCNEKKGTSDSFLRDFLVCDSSAAPNLIADGIRAGAYERARKSGRSELWKMLNSKELSKLTASNGDIDLGFIFDMPISRGPIKAAITHIVKGIHYRLNSRRIPDNQTFLVGVVPSREVLASQYAQLKSWGHVGSAKIGDNKVFSCFGGLYTTDEEAFAASIWGLLFYDRYYIGCITLAPSLTKHINHRFKTSYLSSDKES